MTPAEQRLLWLAARYEGEYLSDLFSRDLERRFEREGWLALLPHTVSPLPGNRWCLTAAGRVAAAAVNPGVLCLAGACVGAPHCPRCR